MEICALVCQKLSANNIIEFEPKIIDKEDNAPQCPAVKVSSPTSPTLRKAFDVVGCRC